MLTNYSNLIDTPFIALVSCGQAAFSVFLCGVRKSNLATRDCSRSTEFILYVVDSYVRGFHVYQDIWTPTTGERLLCQTEDSNAFNPPAACVCIIIIINGSEERRTKEVLMEERRRKY